MTTRSYRQNCALAIALDLIGERWTLLIVRELLLGPRRFRDLEHNLPGIGTNLLSDRLARLVAAGVVGQERLGGGHPRYRLTELGQGLEPALNALILWGMNFPERRAGARHARGEWNILPLRALFQPGPARRWRGAFRVVIDDEEMVVEARDDRLEPAGPEAEVVAGIALDSATAARVASGQLTLADARAGGSLRVTGAQADVDRFFAAFTQA